MQKNSNFKRQVKLMKGNQIRKTNWFLYFWENSINNFLEDNVWLEINLNWRALKRLFFLVLENQICIFFYNTGTQIWRQCKVPQCKYKFCPLISLEGGRRLREFGPMRSNHSTKLNTLESLPSPQIAELPDFSFSDI